LRLSRPRSKEVTLVVNESAAVVFDDERVVANAGVMLPALLAQRLGLEQLVDETIDLDDRDGAAPSWQQGHELGLRDGADGRLHRRLRTLARRPDRGRAWPQGRGALGAGHVHVRSTYYAVRDRPLSARARRDRQITPLLIALWKANYMVYGSRKLWNAARRAGIDIGRDQTARLMRGADIQGTRRSKRVRITRGDPGAGRHPDLVERRFTARRSPIGCG